jgi:hypothetical protein
VNNAQLRHALVLIVATGLVLGLAGPAHAQFVTYDDFSSGAIDPAKWLGLSVEGPIAGPTGTARRVVENGSLRLALTSWGNDSSNSGFVSTRESLNIKQVGTLGGSGFITGMRARITVQNVDVQDCPTNSDSGNSTSNSLRARAEMLGWFFNDGSGSANNGTGNILAIVKLHRGAEGNRISADVTRCLDAACATTTAPVPAATFSTQWALNTPLVLQLVWNQGAGKFTFTATNPTTLATESRDIVYQDTVTNAGPPRVGGFNALRVGNSAKNCDGARKRVLMDALFDDVQVQRQP